MQKRDPRIAQPLRVSGGVSRSGRHYRHPVLEDDGNQIRGLGRHERQVDGKRFLRKGFHLPDLTCQALPRLLEGRDGSEPSGLADGRHERGVGG